MSQEIKVIQNAGINSDATQIATQNNYIGISPEQAAKIAIDIFLDNFPKLQEEAGRIAKERAEAFCNEMMHKLADDQNCDYSASKDPDVQYILNKAQNKYARFGTDELLYCLTNLIVNRIKYNDDFQLKVLLDKSIDIVNVISDDQLNYLTMILYCKHLYRSNIKTIYDLLGLFHEIDVLFPVKGNAVSYCGFLNSFNLLQINLGNPEEFFADNYKLSKEEVIKVMPDQFKKIPGDYGLSPLGRVIAIINYNAKASEQLDLKRFVGI